MGDQPKYQTNEKLGEGSFGKIFRATNLETGEIVALKKMELFPDNLELSSSVIRETSIQLKLNHPNVLKILDTTTTNKGYIYIVLPLAETDLRRYLDTREIADFRKKSISYQIIRGLAYCHARDIIHRDIKTQNILTFRDGSVKICDWGSAQPLLCSTDSEISSDVYTLYYRPPEILLGDRYDMKADIWALGCVISEIYTGEYLFPGDSDLDMLYKIFRIFGTPNESTWKGVSNLPNWKNYFPAYKSQNLAITGPWKDIDPQVRNVIIGMLRYVPSERSDLVEVMRNSFFDDTRDVIDKIFPEPNIADRSCVKNLNLQYAPIANMWLTKEQTAMMAESMWDIAKELFLDRSVYFYALHLLHSADFLRPIVPSKPSNSNLLAISLLCIGCAFKSEQCPWLGDFIHMTKSVHSEAELKDRIVWILKMKDFDILFSTVFDFLVTYRSFYDKPVQKFSEAILATISITQMPYENDPSDLALACIALACAYLQTTFKHTASINNNISRLLKEIMSNLELNKEFVTKVFTDAGVFAITHPTFSKK